MHFDHVSSAACHSAACPAVYCPRWRILFDRRPSGLRAGVAVGFPSLACSRLGERGQTSNRVDAVGRHFELAAEFSRAHSKIHELLGEMFAGMNDGAMDSRYFHGISASVWLPGEASAIT